MTANPAVGLDDLVSQAPGTFLGVIPPKRLAWFLIMLQGRSTLPKLCPAVVELAMQRQDIADYLGLSVETISRTFTLFGERGFINLSTTRRVEMLWPALWRNSQPRTAMLRRRISASRLGWPTSPACATRGRVSRFCARWCESDQLVRRRVWRF